MGEDSGMTRHAEPFDPYDVLGLERGASVVEIRAAHRVAILRHHPDIAGNDPSKTREAQRINAARDLLLERASVEYRGPAANGPKRSQPGTSEPPPTWQPKRRSWEPPPYGQALESVPAWFNPPPVSSWRPSPGEWGPSVISDLPLTLMTLKRGSLDDAVRARIALAHEIHHHPSGKGFDPDAPEWPSVEEARLLARYAAFSVGALLAQDRALWAAADLVASIAGLSPTERRLVQELLDDDVLGSSAYGWISIKHWMVLGDGIDLLRSTRTTSHSEGSLRAELHILTGVPLDREDRKYRTCTLTSGAGLRPPCGTILRPA
jgi:hypothetical protein